MYKPPFEKLETENKEELLSIIQKSKATLTELRDTMEHPEYKCKKCPSELTMYKCERDFLNSAIIRYLSLGGEYVYDSDELAEMEFFAELENIVKIIFSYGACLGLKEEVVIDLWGEKPIMSDLDFDKESFLYELEKLHIGEWKEFYTPDRFGICVLDGYEWNLEIEYGDGRKKEFGGCNAYPYNYSELLELLRL